MFKRFLVVCTGNICRSPLAEIMLSKMLPDVQVRSAGIAVKSSDLAGHAVDSTMMSVANDMGINLEGHQAHQLTKEDCLWSDVILVMEPEQIVRVSKISTQARGKTFLLGQWGEGTIADPFLKSLDQYQAAATQIRSACQSWCKKL
ncbi:phosphotyrosine-protein phosphatase [Vibrio ichthyoenteri ATCC 700023]|uniref:protein-tyrosine-phosphatase n=1 Tax=Vibrio ichthyoenteri ATCC 700023 TaxID=870968 RepID=F9S0F8_9VIBR|nr:low molecular weight protein-tyrosine-phosphatase [Vibrio ichthyoenteri]EGU43428.1 phosphotyrosine-protein phosphatase [Vibrio ichthyoenteri ATCC 700023]